MGIYECTTTECREARQRASSYTQIQTRELIQTHGPIELPDKI